MSFKKPENLTPEQRAQIELCGDLSDPQPKDSEVFDHYSEKITFSEMVRRFRMGEVG